MHFALKAFIYIYWEISIYIRFYSCFSLFCITTKLTYICMHTYFIYCEFKLLYKLTYNDVVKTLTIRRFSAK